MVNKMEIRKAKPEDINTLCKFIAASQKELKGETLTTEQLKPIVSKLVGDFWVAEIGGKICGCISMQEMPIKIKQGEKIIEKNGLFVGNAYVVPEYRGTERIGIKLFKHLLDVAPPNKDIYVAEESKTSIYRRLNFEQAGECFVCPRAERGTCKNKPIHVRRR